MADNTPAVVPGDTDDLNAFTSLFTGGAKAPAPKEEVDNTAEEAEAEVETEEVETEENAEDSDATEEDNSEAADDDDPGEQEDDSEGKAKPKKKSVQERIDELTAARKAAERDAEVARQELAAERRKQLEADKAPKPQDQAPVEAKGQPTPDDKAEDGSEKYPLGELDPLFIRDLTRWTIRAENEAERIAKEERARADVQRQEQAQLDTEFSERVQKVEETLPNYRETVKTLLGTFESMEPAYGNYLASTIKTMEHGPEVLYYLSNNLPEARKIVESGAMRATIALGRLEAQFSQKSASAEKKPLKKVTAAKEPPKTIRGTGGKFAVAADTDDLDAFEKAFLRK